MNGYLFSEHIHRFGVWTAARAASKSRLKNSEVKVLIEEVKLRDEVNMLRNRKYLNYDIYKDWIKEKGTLLLERVKEEGATDFKKDQFSFGLAAKIISIYIKTVEVLPTGGQSELSKVAYPPIDGILLRRFNDEHKAKLTTTWSKFDWYEYIRVIDAIKAKYPSIPMWQVEYLWQIQM